MQSLPRTTLRGALALAVFSAVTTSPAVPLTYFGQDVSKSLGLTNSTAAEASFLSTLSAYGTENLDSIPGFTPDPMLTFPGTGITALTDVDFVATFAPLAVSGSNLLLDDGPPTAGGPEFNDFITLSEPVTAFGSYFVNGGDATTANTLTLVIENSLLGIPPRLVTVATLGPGAALDNVFYFGVTDTLPFDRISIRESFDFDGILLDNITVGFVTVPEPSAWLLLAAGAVSWLCGITAMFGPHRKVRS